ncbi:MAG: glycosyltransferase family 2 protein [Nitrospinae bacterium]|nr:glycosyltransferase family 2 protein [Nitrospinota bacterium]
MISVLMTSYNAQDYIADAVRSILAQTDPDFECIIIDDGSTDDTIRIVKQFCDPRIRLIEAGRIGLARALNLGVRESRGEFIARHDADDLSHPKRFEIQKATMQHFTGYSAVVSPLYAFYAEDVPHWPGFGLEKARTSLNDVRKKLMLFNPVVHTSLFVRRDVMEKIRGYDESRASQLDWDLYVRLYENGLRLGSLKVPVAAKRIHARQFFERGARLRYVFDGVVLQRRAIRALGGGLVYHALLPLWFAYRMLPHKVRMWVKRGYFSRRPGARE